MNVTERCFNSVYLRLQVKFHCVWRRTIRVHMVRS